MGSPSSAGIAAGRHSGGWLAELPVLGGLVAVQVINAGYVVLLNPILSLGIKPAFLIVFGSVATSAFAAPFAIAVESKKWPARLSCTLMAQLVLIALGGVTTFQALLLMGLKKTSPAMASAMPNLAPGLIFVIAACARYERIDFVCFYTKAKILGTIACLAGAVAMSFLQSPSPEPGASGSSSGEEWLVGCLYLLAAVAVVSCTIVLQAAVMLRFPAPFSICAVTSLIGAAFTLALQIASDGGFDVGSPVVDVRVVAAAIMLAGMVTAMCLAFQCWCVQKKGPVLVSMFSPIQTVCSAVFSAVFLGKIISPGSTAGMLLMFSGLYIVLWAKKKEDGGSGSAPAAAGIHSGDDQFQRWREGDDVENPLLS